MKKITFFVLVEILVSLLMTANAKTEISRIDTLMKYQSMGVYFELKKTFSDSTKLYYLDVCALEHYYAIIGRPEEGVIDEGWLSWEDGVSTARSDSYDGPCPLTIEFGYRHYKGGQTRFICEGKVCNMENITKSQIVGQWIEKIPHWRYQYYNFNADGTATITYKYEERRHAPQKIANEWTERKGNRYVQRNSFTGGYDFIFTSTVTQNYTWKVNGGSLEMKAVSTTTTPLQVKPDKSVERGSDPTYARQWAAQVEADWRTNDDGIAYKKAINTELANIRNNLEDVNLDIQIANPNYLLFWKYDNDDQREAIALYRNKDYKWFSDKVCVDTEYKADCIWQYDSKLAYAAKQYNKDLAEAQYAAEAPMRAERGQRAVIKKFMEELKRPSQDKSIGFWGASTILRVDFDNNISAYSYLLMADDYTDVKEWFGGPISKLIPFIDYRVAKIKDNVYEVFVLKGDVKKVKKQKVLSTLLYMNGEAPKGTYPNSRAKRDEFKIDIHKSATEVKDLTGKVTLDAVK